MSEDDDLDEYEFSEDDGKFKNQKGSVKVPNKPHDEEYELSADLSIAESFDAREKKPSGSTNERAVKNDHHDEEFDITASMDNTSNIYTASSKPSGRITSDDKAAKDMKPVRPNDGSSIKSQVITNEHFDEGVDLSQSSSEGSVDTRAERERRNRNPPTEASSVKTTTNPTNLSGKSGFGGPANSSQAIPSSSMNMASIPPQSSKQTANQSPKLDQSSESELEESYENLEGAYNPKEFNRLNVSAEVKDLFQYIERYKPHEVELESSLKCFIPEYIPAVGEIDSFVKVPRPDGKEDDLGFKVLDEPSSNQSDPTVLELQLRSMSKKLQFGDVTVRSIEHAARNPLAIEKWVQNVNDLHRTKPPQSVNYKKNMPDIEKLMEQWPEDFEQVLRSTPLPPPDLDMSLLEYVKVFCAILDIPMYENPIESLHLMFSLYLDFKNNPHFQAKQAEEKGVSDRADSKGAYGDADVLEINPGYK